MIWKAEYGGKTITVNIACKVDVCNRDIKIGRRLIKSSAFIYTDAPIFTEDIIEHEGVDYPVLRVIISENERRMVVI